MRCEVVDVQRELDSHYDCDHQADWTPDQLRREASHLKLDQLRKDKKQLEENIRNILENRENRDELPEHIRKQQAAKFREQIGIIDQKLEEGKRLAQKRDWEGYNYLVRYIQKVGKKKNKMFEEWIYDTERIKPVSEKSKVWVQYHWCVRVEKSELRHRDEAGNLVALGGQCPKCGGSRSTYALSTTNFVNKEVCVLCEGTGSVNQCKSGADVEIRLIHPEVKKRIAGLREFRGLTSFGVTVGMTSDGRQLRTVLPIWHLKRAATWVKNTKEGQAALNTWLETNDRDPDVDEETAAIDVLSDLIGRLEEGELFKGKIYRYSDGGIKVNVKVTRQETLDRSSELLSKEKPDSEPTNDDESEEGEEKELSQTAAVVKKDATDATRVSGFRDPDANDHTMQNLLANRMEAPSAHEEIKETELSQSVTVLEDDDGQKRKDTCAKLRAAAAEYAARLTAGEYAAEAVPVKDSIRNPDDRASDDGDADDSSKDAGGALLRR